MYNRLYLNLVLFLLTLFISGCKFEQLDNKKEINKEIERQTVKRFTEPQIRKEAARLGDSISLVADSLFAAKKATDEKALQTYTAENEPRVKAIADHYQITPKRLLRELGTNERAEVKMLNQTELLYTRPVTNTGQPYVWQFSIPRRVVLESLTLKQGKSQRIRSLFTKKTK